MDDEKIIISYNEDNEMMYIEVDGENIFSGNYWDFDRSPKGLAQFLGRLGVAVTLKDTLESID